ncbi:hypothetical protein PFISCL1PPCAC_21064 [Pristionchus fissidentatus]|uniref:BTB domain-containing protein n=1 Tax=Pristionchus fissidentatus TaxID=1538716 RepID=A0AAV5WD47_9BILA|nr:hypothetical protein PFISCL1PPCAC_21064 [Pristionchus fissidentatus]
MLWQCDVRGEVKLINFTDKSLSVNKPFRDALYNADRYASVTLMEWEEFLAKSEDFICDGSIVVYASIAVQGKSGNRFRKRIASNFYSPSKFSDVILIVEEYELHISKAILAHASSYFETLFYGDFTESRENKITLKDVAFEDFLVVLGLIYATDEEVDDDNVDGILVLADQFDMKRVLYKAETWLVESSNKQFAHKVYLGDKYKLELLLTHCLDEIDSFEKLSEVTTSEFFKNLSESIKDDLLAKAMEMGMKKR